MALIRQLPPFQRPTDEHIRDIVLSLNLASSMLATSTVTFTNGTTSTQVDNTRFSADTVPILVPLDTTAEATTFYVSDRSNGSITFTHADPGADAEYAAVFIG